MRTGGVTASAPPFVIEAMSFVRRSGSTKFWLSTGGHTETVLSDHV